MKDSREQSNNPLKHSKVIQHRSECREEDRDRQYLKEQDETDRACFTGTRGKRPEQKRSAGLRCVEQRKHRVIEHEKKSMSPGKLKDQQSDHELQRDSPRDCLPRDLLSIRRKQPSDACKDQEAKRGNKVIDHSLIGGLIALEACSCPPSPAAGCRPGEACTARRSQSLSSPT